jgi:NADPH-dependent curcumin reductase CurA
VTAGWLIDPSTQGNRRILLASVPSGELREDHFARDEVAVPSPEAGELLCRNLVLSIDPAARAWMSQRTYRAQLSMGEVMAGYTLSQVVAECHSGYAVGDLVFGQGGWQQFSLARAEDVHPVRRRFDLATHMSTLGITGLTAYFGLVRVGAPKPGATVVVSAAAGATGNVVGQLARVIGCRVVGLAGSDAKLGLLTRLGFDAVVNYRDPGLRSALRDACPDGVDLYFDNVGGPVLATVLSLMNIHGCVVCCGAIAGYDHPENATSPPGIPGILVTRRVRMEGFLVHDYEHEWDAAEEILAGHVSRGEIEPLHQVIDGLDNAPKALIGLLAGANVGKCLVAIAGEVSGRAVRRP